MPITERQDIPSKPQVSEPWTFKRLFPFKAAASAFSKVLPFFSPLEILFSYLVVILSLAEVVGRRVSWFVWILTFLIFFASLVERRIWETKVIEEKKPEEIKP